MLKVRTQDGIEGLGEAAPFPGLGGDFSRYSGESLASTLDAIENHLAPIVIGCDPFNVERIKAVWDSRLAGHLIAKAAVEMALFDIQGKIAGLPVFALLGGRYRDGVEIAHTVGIMDKDEALDEAGGAVEEDCRALHVKLRGDLGLDVGLVGGDKEGSRPRNLAMG